MQDEPPDANFPAYWSFSVSPRLTAQTLSVRLGQRLVLDQVELEISSGWTALVGPNGAGKSTLLRALAGLQTLAGGQVLLNGDALTTLPARTRARQLAWLAQQADVTGDLTVRETVDLGRVAHLGLMGAPGAEDTTAVDTAMAMTDCLAWQHQRLNELSGGERQRVMLARVLATAAPILLLDEPTTHLDAPHQVALARLFQRLAHDACQARCVVTVLHDLPIAMHADRLLVLEAGRLTAAGSPRDAQVQRELVRVFGHAIRIDNLGPGSPQVALALGPTDP